jgi:hypothetical protein
LRYNGDGLCLSIVAADGSVGVAKWQSPAAALESSRGWMYLPTPTQWVLHGRPLAERNAWGFAAGHETDGGYGAEWWVAAPHWFLAAAFSVAPLAWASARFRRLLATLAVMSLLLCVAAAVLWVRSYWLGETWEWSDARTDRGMGLRSERGQLSFNLTWWMSSANAWPTVRSTTPERVYYRQANPRGPAGRVATIKSDPNTQGFGPILGLAFFLQWPDADGAHHIELMVPYWVLTVGFIATPALWLRARWKRRRGPPVCAECGYDLRATPGRCPECGVAAAGGAVR